MPAAVLVDAAEHLAVLVDAAEHLGRVDAVVDDAAPAAGPRVVDLGGVDDAAALHGGRNW